jgi:phospholipid/cholesterol/gamma-HCH transport system substrate-binding protein
MIKALAGVAVLAGVLTGLLNFSGDHSYRVTAYFLSAEGLTAQNDVVVGGARVGKVVSVEVAPDADGSQGGARVVIEVDGTAAPLHRGTHASIRPKGLLGNPFVEITPAPAANEVIPSGGVLPMQDTSSPVDIDQVMDLFDANTRQRIQTLTREGGLSLKDRGADLNTFLAALPAISQDTQALTGSIAQRDQQLSALDVEFDRIARMMAAEDKALRSDFSSGASLLDTVAAHDEQLKAELVYAAASLAQLEGGLRGHERDLNQIFRQMPALLDALQSLSNDSAASLAILDPCVGDIIQALAEMRSATAYHDANGDMLRVHPYIGPENVNPARIPCAGARP